MKILWQILLSVDVTAFEVLTLIFCCCGFLVSGDGTSNEYVLTLDSIVQPYQAKKLLHREKRQGGGGFIPFRPLFVYRQQQREQQEKWKEIEARKKWKQQYQQYQATIQQNQHLYQSHRPSAASSYYSQPTTQYSSYNHPSSYYESYYRAYYDRYGKYEKEPVYQQQPSFNPYQDYYDGYYDYSSYFS